MRFTKPYLGVYWEVLEQYEIFCNSAEFHKSQQASANDVVLPEVSAQYLQRYKVIEAHYMGPIIGEISI